MNDFLQSHIGVISGLFFQKPVGFFQGFGQHWEDWYFGDLSCSGLSAQRDKIPGEIERTKSCGKKWVQCMRYHD